MPNTEDLLTLRDGEPFDAVACAALEADPVTARELERLRRVQDALRDLPELPAPDGVWERALAAEQTARLRNAGSWRVVASAAVAAAAALAAIVYVGGSYSPSADVPNAATSSAVTSRVAPQPVPFVAASFVSLVEESGRLDRELAQISYQRPLMMGATAGTIAGLEDRITLIDEQLSYGGVRGGLQPTQQQVLWGERVELMNALVHVRYAQAQPTGF